MHVLQTPASPALGERATAIQGTHDHQPPFADLGDLAFLFFRLLPLKAWFAIARLQGRMQYYRDGHARRIVRDNLASLARNEPEAGELDRMTRSFFERDRVRNLLLLVTPQMSKSQLDATFELEGVEHLEQALSGGKGAVLLLSHLNSIGGFIAVMRLRERGYDVRVALPTSRDGFRATRVRLWLNRVLKTLTFHELTGAFFAQFNVRPIVKLLQSNIGVAFTGDGIHAAAFVTTEFMGRMIPFPTGAMSIARLTGAPVVPLFVKAAPGERLRFSIHPAFFVDTESAGPEALEAGVRAYARDLEVQVRDDPAGWQHCRMENALDTLEGWTDRPLSERYAL